MSNGESKIAIFKAALCCGFAIALRALFLVIRRRDFSRTPFVIASEHNVRAWQSTVCEARIMKDSMPLDCFGQALAMTKIAHAKKFIVMLSVSETSLSVIASKQQPQNLDTF